MGMIDFDESNAQEALVNFYNAIQEHQGFWSDWLGIRLGTTADFFAPTEDEVAAAKAMGDALREIAKLGKEQND